MKPGNKYLLILLSASVLGIGLLTFLGNSQPNVEVMVHNKSGKTISSIHLQTEKSEKQVVIRGVAVGGEVAIKFHNDGADTLFLLVRFPDGKEVKGEGVYFEPGYRVVETVTKEEILTQQGEPLHPSK